jgi:DNA-binding GntR family transcriptional regulator
MENFIKHESLVHQVVQGLEKEILEGTLKPGERIIEEDLCRTLGVSRSPVREAFRILESEGFVSHEPRKGISVRQVTQEEAEDIYLIRANLESLATYLAVKKQNPEILEELKDLYDQMTSVASKKNVNVYRQLNLRFHEALINACGNKQLIQLISTFSKQTVRYRLEAMSVPNWMNSSLKIHEDLIRAFESGDAEKAEEIRKKRILGHLQRFSQKTRKEDIK